MKRIIICVGLAYALSPVTIGQAKEKSGDGNTEQLVLRLESEGREATLKNDLPANDRLLADNWINVNADGSVTTKAKLMELLKAGSFTILSIENDEVMVRVFGEAAVVTGRSTPSVQVRAARFLRAKFVSPGCTPGTMDDGRSFRRTTRLSDSRSWCLNEPLVPSKFSMRGLLTARPVELLDCAFHHLSTLLSHQLQSRILFQLKTAHPTMYSSADYFAGNIWSEAMNSPYLLGTSFLLKLICYFWYCKQLFI